MRETCQGIWCPTCSTPNDAEHCDCRQQVATLIAAWKAVNDAHERSGIFENWECDFGATLGTCPESNACVPCELQRQREKLRTADGQEPADDGGRG